MKIVGIIILLLCVICRADDSDTSVPIDVDINLSTNLDTVDVNTNAEAAKAVVITDTDTDTAGNGIDADNGIDMVDTASILFESASVTDNVPSPPAKPTLIRRNYDYQRQTRLAVLMMVFIAVAFTTSESWNPR